MRKGVNLIKLENDVNKLRNHRIIIVFYIPDSGNEFFADLDVVLDKCLESLVKTISFNTTAITLINNNSRSGVEKIVKKYKMYIDKYVIYNENKGKVFAVLNEVRGVYEEFVTITDADILFFSGWEKSVFDVFRNVPYAGVVSPMPLPFLTFHFNKSIFGFNTLRNRLRYIKLVRDEDIDLYCYGTNLPELYIRQKHEVNWKEKQFVYTINGFEAVVGAYHVVSTYRTAQFRGIYNFPVMKFRNSYESYFIDNLSEKKGLYRLSTKQTFAYHMGNHLDDNCVDSKFNDTSLILTNDDFLNIKMNINYNIGLVFIKNLLGRIFIKFYWIKKGIRKI